MRSEVLFDEKSVGGGEAFFCVCVRKKRSVENTFFVFLLVLVVFPEVAQDAELSKKVVEICHSKGLRQEVQFRDPAAISRRNRAEVKRGVPAIPTQAGGHLLGARNSLTVKQKQTKGK